MLSKNLRKDFLPLSRPCVADDEISAALAVVKSGWWTTGANVARFESEMSAYLKEDVDVFTAALSSCTAGLHLALLALGIGAGDEVIVPTMTFAATAQVVGWVGAKLVLCDINEDTLNIDTEKAEKLITARTKAIIPVHMGGYPCDMAEISRIAKKYKLKVIEDAAHAIGTRYNGRKIGNFSDITVFSFYVTKNLAMGEGGMAVSRDKALIDKIKRLSYFGINKEAFKRYEKSGSWFYDIEEMGYKYNLDDLHGAIGLAQLRKLDAMNDRRREIAGIYRRKLIAPIRFTKDSDEHFHIYYIFQIKVPGRDALINKLKERNIGTSVHFIPLHMHSFYRSRFPGENFPVANKVFSEILSIPMFPSMNEDDVGYVITNLNDLLRRQDG
ncbi:MAG: DegT/DnrJ/EryC1/StrS family aminotransferase [Candidatus Omnitrophica bacterium]|nr:DegT/DnrJ/EryC1/StrS family aminotransferase [Candidatus Omnitrophota bacterium]